MKAMGKRLGRLEAQLGIADNRPAYVLILSDAGFGVEEQKEAYMNCLAEDGHFQPGRFSLVDLTKGTNRFGREATNNPSSSKSSSVHGPTVTVKLLE